MDNATGIKVELHKTCHAKVTSEMLGGNTSFVPLQTSFTATFAITESRNKPKGYTTCFNETMIISVKTYIGSYFCTHYNSFVTKAKGEVRALDVHTLADHRPLHARQL